MLAERTERCAVTSRGRGAEAATAILGVVLLAGARLVAAAQRRRFFYGWDETVKNMPYDGRFTFARVRYRPAPGGNWAGGRPSWVHGYPLAEQNLMRIMKEVSLLDAHADEMNVVTLDDPELFKYPDCLHHRGRLVDAHRQRRRPDCAPTCRRAAS